MSNCQVSHSKQSGVRVNGLITINGSGTSIHNNECTGGYSNRYGLHTGNGNSDDIVLHNSSMLQKFSTYSSNIRVPCMEQGVSLENSQFESNKAGLNGGAIATPDKLKNAFFQLKNTTFDSFC